MGRPALRVVSARRSQSLHSTEAAKSRERRGKQNRAEGRGIGRWTREFSNEEGESKAPAVPEAAKQGAETRMRRDWSWVEASVWNERMLAALENGVKGGKWFSLMDKVYRTRDAWRRPGQKVAGERGRSRSRRSKRGAVCGTGGDVLERAEKTALRRGKLQATARAAGGNSQRRGPEASAGHPGGERPHRADGGEAGAGADL